MAENQEMNANPDKDPMKSDETMGSIDFDMPKNRSNVIKVIGVGGGGGNAINHMYEAGINGVDFAICNTDAQALQNSPVPNKIQLGVNLTEGLGAGANPEVGEKAAMESMDDIKAMLGPSTKMVFITAGMGGGTGTGAAPIIAKVAREMDILTVGIVTIPFQFEGIMRCQQAQKGIDVLRENVDSLIVVNNNKLREVYGNLGFRAGFAKADEVLAIAAKGIAEVITHHYMQNIDLRDAKTVLSNSGTAIMGSADATGSGRAKEAIVNALDSPLLNDNKITGAKNVLLLIVSGSQEITIDEIGEINDHIQIEAGYGANIIMGIGEDESLGEAISVTIIATGFNSNQQAGIVNSEERKIVHNLDSDSEDSLGLDASAAQAESDEIQEVSDPSGANPYAEAVERLKLEEMPVESEQITPSVQEEIPSVDKTVFQLEDELPAQEIEVNAPLVETPGEPIAGTESSREEDFELPVAMSILREIEVVSELISPVIHAGDTLAEEDDFVIIESTEMLRNIEVVGAERIMPDEEIVQTTLAFDQPLSGVETREDEEENTIIFDLSEGLKNIPLVEDEATDEPRLVQRDLAAEEYLEEEARLMAANAEEKQPQASGKVNPIMNKTNTEVISEVQSQPENQLEGEEDPFFKSISDTNSRPAKTARTLKEYNYRFRANRTSIDEIENEPAYKRQGIDLDDPQNETNISRTTLGEDSNKEPQLRSNNSFLHDNVD